MLTRYELTLEPERDCTPIPEWGYRLYAAMLHRAGDDFGAAVHEDQITPVSQFLSVREGRPVWSVSLLGDSAEEALIPVVEGLNEFHLDGADADLRVTARRAFTVQSTEELFALAAASRGRWRMQFCTPTAFKSRGEYLTLPTARLMMQKLIRKWNGCITDCPIEDEDGEGMEALADGLVCTRYRLESRFIRLKGSRIPGFTGTMEWESRLSGFHRELADALMTFAAFSGIGIKTTLGMGGVRVSNDIRLSAGEIHAARG